MTRGKKSDKVLRRDALPVPRNLPEKTKCINVQIPDDLEYEVHFYSVLRLLTKWNSYQQDGGHKAADVANIWKAALKLSECEDCEAENGITIGDDMTCGMRVNPDNNCQLQINCNGEWVLFWDISKCVSDNLAHPTNGGDFNSGDCREWDAVITPGSGWLIPVALNADDVIVTESIEGSWASNFLDWHCPDGTPFAFGACIGSPSFSGLDPAPSLAHMRLLLNVGGVLADGYNTTYAVAGGVTDAIGVLLANSDAFLGPSGSIKVHVKVCRPGEIEAPITMTYDYGSGATTLPDSGIFSVQSACCGGGGAHDWGIGILFSEPVHIEVLSSFGFTIPGASGHVLYSTIRSGGASGSIVSGLYEDESLDPSAIPSGDGNYYSISSGSGDISYQITLRVTRL